MDAVCNICVFLFLIVSLALSAMLFKPNICMKLIKRNLSRKQIALSLSGIIILLFVTISITAPENSSQIQKSSQQSVSSEETLVDATKSDNTETAVAAETKDIEEKQVIAFSEQRIETSSLVQGQEQIVQEGQNGEKILMYSVTYVNGEETGRTLKSETVATQPINKIISVGTYISASSKSSPSSSSSSSSSVYYKNCTAARAAGVTPIYAGQPGYASHLDRDNDGIACED